MPVAAEQINTHSAALQQLPCVISLFLWVRSLDTTSQRSLLEVFQGRSEVLIKAVFSSVAQPGKDLLPGSYDCCSSPLLVGHRIWDLNLLLPLGQRTPSPNPVPSHLVLPSQRETGTSSETDVTDDVILYDHRSDTIPSSLSYLLVRGQTQVLPSLRGVGYIRHDWEKGICLPQKG